MRILTVSFFVLLFAYASISFGKISIVGDIVAGGKVVGYYTNVGNYLNKGALIGRMSEMKISTFRGYANDEQNRLLSILLGEEGIEGSIVSMDKFNKDQQNWIYDLLSG